MTTTTTTTTTGTATATATATAAATADYYSYWNYQYYYSTSTITPTSQKDISSSPRTICVWQRPGEERRERAGAKLLEPAESEARGPSPSRSASRERRKRASESEREGEEHVRVERSQRLLATEGVRQAGGMHRRVSSPWGFGSLELVKDLPIPWEWYLKSDDKPL